jgi:hypothetical protein
LCRYAADQTCDLKPPAASRAAHHVDYMSEQVVQYAGKTQPRRAPIPSKPAEVYLGREGAVCYELNPVDPRACNRLVSSLEPVPGFKP